MRYLAIIAALGCYSPASHAFLESLGVSILGTAVWEWTTSQEPYRPRDYESPVEQTELNERSTQHCDPYGGCRDYVSTTVIRKVREYRYDYRPEWDSWAYGNYD
jgi:hypothetical protein